MPAISSSVVICGGAETVSAFFTCKINGNSNNEKRKVCRGVVGEGGKGAHQPDQGNNHCDEANCNQIAVGRTLKSIS